MMRPKQAKVTQADREDAALASLEYAKKPCLFAAHNDAASSGQMPPSISCHDTSVDTIAMSTTSITTSICCVLLFASLMLLRNALQTLKTWKYLLGGRAIMMKHAQQNPHEAYAMPIPGKRLHVVSSKNHWRDINNASTSQLSPNAASREMFQPRYTFDFDWAAPREHVSLATVRSIRNMTLQIPAFQTRFLTILEQEFRRAMNSSPKEAGWTRISLWPTLQRTVARINTLLLLGESVASNEEFTTRGLNFVNQTTLILEGVRLVPSFLAPLVAKLIKGRGRDRRFVFETLRRLISEREAYNREASDDSRAKPKTFLEGVIDYAEDGRSTQQHVDSINSTWVISTLAIPVVTCQLLQDLYTQPSDFAALRKEADAVPLMDPARSKEISDRLGELPLLEAFAMESWRTNCFQANTAHRMAMKTFRFSDGYKVPAGELIEFHQRGLMNDDTLYPEPAKFDPSRFLNKGKSIVDTGIEWPFWGVPRYICPGRWHVANVEKLVAVFMMQNFEAKFESSQGLNFEWRDSLVPNPKMVLLMKPRKRDQASH